MAGFFLIIAIIVVGVWWASVRIHPIRRCPSCKGGKRNRGSSETRWGLCPRCGGKGEVRRFGAGAK